MPIVKNKDSDGPYYRHGSSGRKYYYTPGGKKSRNSAHKKAAKNKN